MGRRREIAGSSTPRVREHRVRTKKHKRDPLKPLCLWLSESEINQIVLDLKAARPGEDSKERDEKQWRREIEQAARIIVKTELAARRRKK